MVAVFSIEQSWNDIRSSYFMMRGLRKRFATYCCLYVGLISVSVQKGEGSYQSVVPQWHLMAYS
jgi:hypothetical protein